MSKKKSKEIFYLIHSPSGTSTIKINEFESLQEVKDVISDDLAENNNYCFTNGDDVLIQGKILDVELSMQIKIK